ncbi:MAG: class I SAM-dependent methyltransferase [Acidobacteriota bacterium]|jgi:16S rRNA (guanine527-N7)-methyltransferase
MDERFAPYLELLFRWNPVAGLTAFRNRETAYSKGVIPSLEARTLLPDKGAVLDIGAGGGIPAVPLATVKPGLTWVLCEPAAKKSQFLREAARVLSLSLEIRECTVEEFLSLSPGARFHAATVRGVRLRKGLVKRVGEALVPGGALLVWTAGDAAARLRGWLDALGWARSEHLLGQAGQVIIIGRVPRGTI